MSRDYVRRDCYGKWGLSKRKSSIPQLVRPMEHGNEQFKSCQCSEIQIDKLKVKLHEVAG